MAGLAWAGSAEAESRDGGLPAGAGLGQRYRQAANLSPSRLCFVSGPQQGQVCTAGTGGSGFTTVPLSATSPPSLPLRTDSQLRLPTSGALFWQTCPGSWEWPG